MVKRYVISAREVNWLIWLLEGFCVHRDKFRQYIIDDFFLQHFMRKIRPPSDNRYFMLCNCKFEIKKKDLLSFTRAQRVLSYHLILVPRAVKRDNQSSLKSLAR